MSLPIEPPRLPEIQEIYLEVHKIFVLILLSKISEMLNFHFLHHKKTTPKTARSFTLFKFSIFSFHHIMELLCRITQSTLLTVTRIS